MNKNTLQKENIITQDTTTTPTNKDIIDSLYSANLEITNNAQNLITILQQCIDTIQGINQTSDINHTITTLLENTDILHNALSKKEDYINLITERKRFIDSDISVSFPGRTANVLHKYGIKNGADLVKQKQSELFTIMQIGKKAKRDIEQKIQTYLLHYDMNDSQIEDIKNSTI